VAEGEGRFAPREVVLGSEGDGDTEVLSGLQAGDKVVTSAQFLLDSESSLREVIQKMVAAAKGQ
jgi:membrane fusion protein, copper/silver efflux system